MPSDSGAAQFTARFEIEDDDGNLAWKDVSKLDASPDFRKVKRAILEDNGRGYPYDEIARENPMKRGAVDTAGEHGEGLLMAALACVRRDIQLVYESRDWTAAAVAFPEKDDPDDPNSPHGWYLSYLTTFEEFKRQGSRTVFERVTPELAEQLYNLRENLLYLMPNQIMGRCHREAEEESERTVDGEVVRLIGKDGEKEPKNKIFVKGVYSTHRSGEPLLFSYNLNIATPRDRHYIPDLEENLARVFTNSCTPQMAARMLDCTVRKDEKEAGWYIERGGSVYGEDKSGYYEISHLLPVLEGNCSAAVQDMFRTAFEAKFGKNAVIATNSEATKLFMKQQGDITKGKTLVYVTKNMATFLRRGCGVPFDIDVVQFPKEIDRSTSLALESINIQRIGLERALFDLLKVHFESSGGQTVKLKFECEGEAKLFTLKDLRDRPELQAKVKRIEIHASGQGIEEAALRLDVRTEGGEERALHKLPGAITAMLFRGIQPQIQSRNWEATARVQAEKVAGEDFRSVAYDVQQFAGERFPGLHTILQPLNGIDVLPAEAIQHLLKMSGEVYFLEPERFGKPVFKTRDGVTVLGGGETSGLVFINGELKVRYENGTFNYLIPEPVWKNKDTKDPLKSTVIVRPPWVHISTTGGKSIQLDTKEMTLKEYISFVIGRSLFQDFPRENSDACVTFLRGQIAPTDTTGTEPSGTVTAETQLLEDFQKASSAARGFIIVNEDEFFPAHQRQTALWKRMFFAAIDAEREEATVVLHNSYVSAKRTAVSGIGDFLGGKRSEFSRQDWLRNASLHQKRVVAVTSSTLMIFLKTVGVPLDTELSMKYVPFFERNPWMGRSVVKTAKATALAAGLTLAGITGLNIYDGFRTGFLRERLEPDEEHDLYTESPEGIKIHLSTILKALLVGGGLFGLLAAYSKIHEKFEEWERAPARPPSPEKRKKRIIKNLTTAFRRLQSYHEIFGAIQIQFAGQFAANFSFDRETKTILINSALLSTQSDDSLFRGAANCCIEKIVDDMTTEEAKTALKDIFQHRTKK